MKTRKLTEDISEQIWKYIWDNSSNEDTDEDLCNEHTMYCEKYIKGDYLKFIR